LTSTPIPRINPLVPPTPPAADPARSAATFAEAALRALAREEALGRRPRRLLEPSLATWAHFKGRLELPALLEILLEDAAVSQPVPFDPTRVLGAGAPLARVPADKVHRWLDSVSSAAPSSSAEYVAAQARLLGLPTRLGRSDLPVVKPHQRVLELPGTGGQLAHHLLDTHPDLPIREVFTVACGSWQELVLAGLVFVEKGVLGEPPAALDPGLEAARAQAQARAFDFVFGVDAGIFSQAQLASWFPHARVMLV
jgi:hypothetical protein